MNEKLLSVSIIIFLFTQITIVDDNDIKYDNSINSEGSMITDIPVMDLTQLDVRDLFTNTPTAFTENRGQLENDEVRFYDQGENVWFTDDGMWMELREELSIDSPQSTVFNPESRLTTEDWRPTTNQYKRVVLKQEFVGANQVRPIGRETLGYYSNFFYGNDSSKWCTKVPNYGEVYYENIYDGIDLRYYTNENGLKYDFIVHPGSDVSQIRIRYEGAEKLLIDGSENLIIKTQIENIVDGGLYIYQDIDGQHHKVKGRFTKYNDLEYGFKLLDNYNEFEDLIIDPLIYSTYIGGISSDVSGRMAKDSMGNVFVTGYTSSIDFPNTTGAFDTSFDNQSDVFILKLNQNGSALHYSTYVGGNQDDHAWSIATDLMGNVYVTGSTESLDFPTTQGAYDRTYNGKSPPEYSYGDIFVLKLNQNGSGLNYSTYIGGNYLECGQDIKVDSSGRAYVKGITSSPNFPNTIGAFDTTFGGKFDAVVFMLTWNGSGLVYSTFIGGSEYELSYSYPLGGLEIDSFGNAYITGSTNSSDFPTTPWAYSSILTGGKDIFFLKLNWNGSKLLYSTLLGGSDDDFGIDIAIDSFGNVFIAGITSSLDFPVTIGSYNTSISGVSDVVVIKLNLTSPTLIYSTYIGGSDSEGCGAIAIDINGYAYVTGQTMSSNFPITSNANDTTFNGINDCIVFTLNPNGSKLVYSSFIGGSSIDSGGDIAVDIFGNIYVTGTTFSTDFYTTPGAYDRSFNGFNDVFVLKFSYREVFNITSLSLLLSTTPITNIYSKLGTYTFKVNITNTDSESDIGIVRLDLDPLNTNIQLVWDNVVGKFSKAFDPYNYVTLEKSSKAFNDTFHNWTIDFNVTFNWTYPDEELHDIRAFVTNTLSPSIWLNKTNLYRVENDLMFNGTLTVIGEDNRTISNGSFVHGGEKLKWTGLTPTYEGTTDIYPPDDEIDITIWDETDNYWSDSPNENEPFTTETTTPNQTYFKSFNYTINLTGIPQECDKTNTTFSIRIDGNNVSFSNHRPKDDAWQKTNNVFVGVTITDTGGGFVNSSSVMQCISSNNGMTWGAWEQITELNDGMSIIVQKFATFEDGKDNLIKWRAKDSLKNGPTESEPFKVLVDTQDLMFSNAWPSVNEESPSENVTVGITLSDITSGVDSSKIKYTVSYDAGITWDYWRSVPDFKNEYEVNVTLNLTFFNGTDNLIKWQAYDIAGNGPVVSEEYVINVNRIIPPVIPKVELQTPQNNSIISTSSIELSWRLNNSGLTGVTYKVIVDDIYPPVEVKQSNLYTTNFMLTELEDGKTYYWTVTPKLDTNTGSCLSGIWSFTVDIIHIKPSVELISPPNGSIIQALRPTFVWTINYDGSEELTYDIYLGKNRSLEMEILDYPDTNYLSKDILVFNETYYWKVVPKAGDKTGIESEIFGFTVRPKDYVPTFSIELILEPSIIEIKPDEIRYVNATVTNLGEITDKIVLSIPEIIDSRLIVEINEPKMIEVEPKGYAVFNITVQVKEDGLEDEISIIFVAASSNAASYDQVVEKRATLTVKISSQGKHDTGKSTDASWYWIIILIIFVIIIVLIIVGLIIKRKQKPKQEPPPVEASTPEPKVEVSQTPEIVPEIVTTAPTTIPTVDTIEVDSTPPIQATPTPIPGQTPLLQMSEAPAQAPAQPQLQATTTMTTPTSQMAQVQPLPQLPSVQIETPQQLPIEPEIIQPQPATETQQQKKPSIEEEVDEKINGQKNN